MNGQHTRSTVGIALGAVVGAILLWSGLAGAGDAVLVMPEKEFNFGYAVQNASISHPFLIKNGGGDTLYIIDVNPG